MEDIDVEQKDENEGELDVLTAGVNIAGIILGR